MLLLYQEQQREGDSLIVPSGKESVGMRHSIRRNEINAQAHSINLFYSKPAQK